MKSVAEWRGAEHTFVGSRQYGFLCVELCYQECFEIAGGARDACWTDTNEDASIASVKQVGTPTCVPAYAILCVVMFSCCASSLVVLHLKNILMKGHALDPDYTQPG